MGIKNKKKENENFPLFAPSGSGRVKANIWILFLALVVFLLFSPSVHAAPAWQSSVFIALLASVLVVAAIFMLVTFAHMEALKSMIRDELVQVFLTSIIALVLMVEMPNIDGGLAAIVCGASGPSFCANSGGADINYLLFCQKVGKNNACQAGSVNQWAMDVNARHMDIMNEVSVKAVDYSNAISKTGAKAGFVNLLGIGMGISGCSAYGVLRGPLGQLLNANGFAIMDLEAERLLMTMNNNPNTNTSLVLSLLLPLGILLRALHITRKAGSALIGLALALYLIFPSALVFAQGLADRFVLTYTPDNGATHPYVSMGNALNLDAGNVDDSSSRFYCDPFDPDETKLSNPSPPGLVESLLNDSAQWLLFWVIVRTLMMTAFALTVTFGAARAFGHLMNTEFDVSAIARLS